MRHVAIAAVVATAVVVAACGGSSSGSTAADVQRLDALSQSVAVDAAAYGAKAAAMADMASCLGDESAYDAQVRPMLAEMQGMAPAMDAEMGSMGHMSDADMACGAQAMAAELDRHRGVACASATDMAPNRDEAQAHVAAMADWANHEMARSRELGTMMGMGMGGMGGPMATGHCVHEPDGSYALQP